MSYRIIPGIGVPVKVLRISRIRYNSIRADKATKIMTIIPHTAIVESRAGYRLWATTFPAHSVVKDTEPDQR